MSIKGSLTETGPELVPTIEQAIKRARATLTGECHILTVVATHIHRTDRWDTPGYRWDVEITFADDSMAITQEYGT